MEIRNAADPCPHIPIGASHIGGARLHRIPSPPPGHGKQHFPVILLHFLTVTFQYSLVTQRLTVILYHSCQEPYNGIKPVYHPDHVQQDIHRHVLPFPVQQFVDDDRLFWPRISFRLRMPLRPCIILREHQDRMYQPTDIRGAASTDPDVMTALQPIFCRNLLHILPCALICLRGK